MENHACVNKTVALVSHRCLEFFKSRQALSLELDWFSWNMVFPGYLLPDKHAKRQLLQSKV